MGPNMRRLLKFAHDYPFGWHTYGKDRSTVDAIGTLAGLGFIEVNENRQFRLAFANDSRQLIDDALARIVVRIQQGLDDREIELTELDATHALAILRGVSPKTIGNPDCVPMPEAWATL